MKKQKQGPMEQLKRREEVQIKKSHDFKNGVT